MLSKRTRSDEQSPATPLARLGSDRLTLEVGGETFVTSVTTLTGSSSYFARQLSTEWRTSHDDSTFFLDRDAEPFKVLLSFMRTGAARLPKDADAFAAVMQEAEYLGVDGLIDYVKLTTQHNLHGELEWTSSAAAPNFDEEHGGINGALASGILPSRYFAPEPKAPPPKPKIIQLVPAAEPQDVHFHHPDSFDRFILPMVSLALIDNGDGTTTTEPLVARPDGEHGCGGPMVVLASEWAKEDSPLDDALHWTVHRRPTMHVLPKGALVANRVRNSSHPVVMCQLTYQKRGATGEEEPPKATFLAVSDEDELVDVQSLPGFKGIKAVDIVNKASVAEWDLLDLKLTNGDTEQSMKAAKQAILCHPKDSWNS